MYEYVASGMSHVFYAKNERVAKYLNKLKCYDEQCFSMLYNAFTETRTGIVMKEFKDLDAIYKVHADSGGLQMITRNMIPTPELREKVYMEQAKNSCIAMSFDEIPLLIETASGKTEISDLGGRFFDMENLVQRARDSGQNVKDQVRYFKKVKTKAEPLVILQGNCLDTYEIWTNELMDVLGDDFQHTSGLAMSPTSIGMGLYEDCVRAIALKTNPYNTDKVHLLGIGSLNRMLPFIVMNAQDWFGKNYHISYDSTSHSRALWGGLDYYRYNLPKIRANKDIDNQREVYDDICKIFEDEGVDVTFHEFSSWCNARCSLARFSGILDVSDEELRRIYSTSAWLFLLGCIYNFMKEFDDVQQNIKALNNPIINILDTLKGVDSKADGVHWLNEYGQYLKSRPVLKSTNRPGSLSQFLKKEKS